MMLAVVLVGQACSEAVPQPTPAHSQLAVSPTVAPSAIPSAAPLPTASSTPSIITSPSVAELTLDIQVIPAKYASTVNDIRSLGNEIIWAAESGARASGADTFFRYIPGAEAPDIIFTLPRDHCSIGSVAGSRAGYAFTEYCVSEGELRGPWQLWFTPGPGHTPVLLDQGDNDNTWPSNVTMSDRYIAWDGTRNDGEARVSQLRVAATAEPARIGILVSYDIDGAYVEFPSINGDELWYGVSRNDWDNGLEFPRIEMLDLSNRDAEPLVLGEEIRAFMPAPRDDVVVFKSGGLLGLSGINSGRLTAFWRDSGQIQELRIPGEDPGADRVSYPSVGDRFAAWHDEILDRFYLYDLKFHQFARLADWNATGSGRSRERSLSGNLLAYVYWDANQRSSIRWALLPD
jgi:hypothetical protein